MCLPYLFKSMSDTEIAFVFDKNLGLVETRVPRTNGGASVTIVGTLSASVLQGSGSGGGGDSSFPLDPIPTVGSFLVTDADGNPTTSTGTAVTVNNSGVSITSPTLYNRGFRITTTSGSNYGIDITSTAGTNQGIDITSTTGSNQGINISTTSTGANYGLDITSQAGVNSGLKINSTSGYNYGIEINSTTGTNYGIKIQKTDDGNNYGLTISSASGYNRGITIDQTGAGVNYGITISASGGATNNGLTITGGSGGVTVDGVNIVPLAINANYPLVQSAHTSATRTLALADAQDIVPLSAASNAIEVTIPHTLFGIGGTGRAFECRLRAMSVAGGAITFVGSGGIVITYHGKNPGTTPIVAGDFIRVVVTSATSADVWVDGVAV